MHKYRRKLDKTERIGQIIVAVTALLNLPSSIIYLIADFCLSAPTVQ